jgi:DNA topoisomerase-1
MSNLVIVESPAKCAKIRSFLGSGWNVIATMGHIRALEEDLDAIGIDRDFEPRFEFLKTKSKAIAGIRDAFKSASQVYLAADDDREGEAIAYSVCKLLKLDPTATPRAVFHEITKQAVLKAVAEPRRIDMPKVYAQQARSMLDMMIGFTMSPLLWGMGRGLSAGRCQTPALRLVVEKEKEIEGFSSSLTWAIDGLWVHVGTADRKFSFKAAMVDSLEDEDSVINYLENRQGEPGAAVSAAVVKPWREGSPVPFITSTLQQQSSAILRYNPKRTMQIAQKLYEGGHITYMRTDSTALSDEAREDAVAWIKATYGEEYLGAVALGQVEVVKKPKAKAKKEVENPELPVAQAAHECIRPTHMEEEEINTDDPSEKALYKMIRNRTLQSLMAEARGETRTVTFDCDGDDKAWPWRASWKRTTFEGWRKLGRVAAIDDAETDEEEAKDDIWTQTSRLVVGSRLTWQSLEGRAVISRPTSRYTEATLVRELEKRGIGRPSTFASLIGAIVDKGYVEVKNIEAKKQVVNHYELLAGGETTVEEKELALGGEKQKMVPTALGRQVIEFLMREYSDIFDYSFTANMEAGLDLVASGASGNPWKKILYDTWNSYKDRYLADKERQTAGPTGGGGPSDKIKMFGEYKAVMSKKGPLLLKEGASKADATVFYGWPEGTTWESITEAVALEFITEKAAEKAAAGPPAGILKKIGPFIFREGKEGRNRYMYKDGLKDRKFVSVPESLNLEKTSEKEAEAVYKHGLAVIKERGSQNKGRGQRGGFGGRGRGRA